MSLSSPPSSSNFFKSKQKLIQDRYSSLNLFVWICFVLSILFVSIALEELYKCQTLVIALCQIQSNDVKYIRNSFYPSWNVRIQNQNQTIIENLIGFRGYRSDKLAWIDAKKYLINETYLCYHSRNSSWIFQWGWQWKQPSYSKIYPFLFTSAILFLLGIIFIIVKKNYQKKIQQQQYHQLLSIETQPVTPV